MAVAKRMVCNRVYDPGKGRWLSRDPAGEGIGSNLFSYTTKNPIRYTDPLGLCPGCSGADTFNCVARCIDQNKFDWGLLLPALLTSAYPKWMLPPFRVPYLKQPITTLPSVAVHYGVQGARALGRILSVVGTPLLIGEGFIDIGVIGMCGYTCGQDCHAY
jgi:hypothetical protein